MHFSISTHSVVVCALPEWPLVFCEALQMDVFRAASGRVKGKPLGTKLKSRSSRTSFSVSSGSHSSTFFRKGNYAERACVGAPVNMDAAVLEYLSLKVLEFVANAGRDSEKSKIIPGQ